MSDPTGTRGRRGRVVRITLAAPIAARTAPASHASALAPSSIDSPTTSRHLAGRVHDLARTGDADAATRQRGAYGGTWAFTVAHVDNSDPETGLEPEPHGPEGEDPGAGTDDHPHRDFVRLVQRGALAGAIDDAVLTFDAGGALTAVAASLSIGQGTGEFTGAVGSGRATLTDLTLLY